MTNVTTSAAIATVTTCLCGYLITHARGHWSQPARHALGALSRIVFVVMVSTALSGGLIVAVAELPLPGLSSLKVLFLVLALVGPWVVIWGVIKAQRLRLNKSYGTPRTAQSLLHVWLVGQIGGTMATGYLHGVNTVRGWNDTFTVLSVLMGLALTLLPAFRREVLRLWSSHAHVVIKRASLRVSGAAFCALWVWAYLGPLACPDKQCEAGGGRGLIWAFVFSFGCGWLIATTLVQLGAILRWLDERSRNPGPPPPWLRRLLRAVGRPQDVRPG